MTLVALNSEAVILRTYPLKESDKLIVLFSQNYGKIRGVVKGCRRIRSRFSGRLEPLSWVEFSGYERKNQDLVSIDNVEVLKGFGFALEDYSTFLRSSYLLEVITKTLPDREINKNLFRLLLHVLPAFVKIKTSQLALLYFQVWHLKLGGFFPDLYHCCQCGNEFGGSAMIYCEIKSQGFICKNCKHGMARQISVESMRVLERLTKKSLADLLREIQLSKVLNELNNLIEELMEISYEKKFNSLLVLKQEVGGL